MPYQVDDRSANADRMVRLTPTGRQTTEPRARARGGIAARGGSFSAYCTRVRAELTSGSPATAVGMSRLLLAQFPRSFEARCLLGEGYLAAGEPAAAAGEFQIALAADPESAAAHAGLATATEHLGSRDSAISLWERVLELDPAAAEPRQRLASLRGEGEVGAAQQRLTLAALARIHFRGGLLEHAEAGLRSLVAAAPERADLHVALAQALWRLGRREESAQVASALLQRLPDCVKANALAAAGGQLDARGAAEAAVRARAADPAGLLVGELFEGGEGPAELWVAEPEVSPAASETPEARPAVAAAMAEQPLQETGRGVGRQAPEPEHVIAAVGAAELVDTRSGLERAVSAPTGMQPLAPPGAPAAAPTALAAAAPAAESPSRALESAPAAAAEPLEDVETLRGEGDRLRGEGRYTEAIVAYGRALRLRRGTRG